jgi:hypothetical protein
MGKTAKYTVLFLILAAGNAFAFGSRQNDPPPYAFTGETTVSAVQPQQPAQQNQSRAEQVMRALAQAYPRQIARVEYRSGDWAVLLRDTWYYYAEGRILPENLRSQYASYSPIPFYNYLAELPAWRAPNQEESERYANMASSRNRNPLRRSSHFFDDLWRAHSRSESDSRVKTMLFLGKSVNVHFMIMESLALVEEQIVTAARADRQIQTWINNINTLEGWSWRNIAETQSRSYHSYGLAVDILPKSLGGKETYWLWAARTRTDWWNISYNDRYHPPNAVIKAFEMYGFVWGGKWMVFDTMHFEYRPEIFILSGIPLETRR